MANGNPHSGIGSFYRFDTMRDEEGVAPSAAFDQYRHEGGIYKPVTGVGTGQ